MNTKPVTKTQKNYRLSPMTIRELDVLKERYPGVTETQIIEMAITHLLHLSESG
ncbi:MAG: hypothetical protein K2K53_12010 [Oscillospiraceae bacterium]|nr:hypothetical protein [Oscillospiraceae bacterium]